MHGGLDCQVQAVKADIGGHLQGARHGRLDVFKRDLDLDDVHARSPCRLLRALLASGQITIRKADGWQTLDKPIVPMPRDRAA